MSRGSRRTALICFLIITPLAMGPAACGDIGHSWNAAPYDATAQIALSVGEDGRTVDPDNPLEVTARGDDSRITAVRAVDTAGRRLSGELSADGTRWHSTTPLTAATRYTVLVETERDDGAPGRRTADLTTGPAEDARRLDVVFGPRSGTYGVGQPITAELSRAVDDRRQRAIVEGALRVDSSPASAQGSWHWVDSRTLHYRPRTYWPAHATITARGVLEGVWVGDGLRGGTAEPLRIRTGDRVEAVADISTLRMTVRKNGRALRTIPITTGKPGFETRDGVKVILAREAFVRMTGTSIGIPAGSPDSYDLPVHWAVRITESGEYLHAAPWSAQWHGRESVSHGCTGMSMDNARWFFSTVREGDIVRYVGGDGPKMPSFGNGYGDWNLSWEKWRAGSALHRPGK